MKNKKKILLIFGTRPEAIKLVPVIKAFQASDRIELKICVSAQHREMLDSVLNEYSISADWDLDVMEKSQTLDLITAKILCGVGKVIDNYSPDLILVHGDTSTAFASALSAFYRRIPVGHIEAGLRSGNLLSPHPEEFNRRAISLMARYHFAPTALAANNLLAEGIAKESIFTVGNTAIDILKSNLKDIDIQNSSELIKKPLILITVHRREHGEDELLSIFRAIRTVCSAHPEIRAIYPLHKNPKLRQMARIELDRIKNLTLCEPLETKAFHSLLYSSHIVLTDSGGIQEEAAFLGKPTLVLRDTTERPEGIVAGVLRLVGSDSGIISKNIDLLLGSKDEYLKMSKPTDAFGDGNTGERIARITEKLL